MNIFYIIGVVVVVLFVAGYFGHPQSEQSGSARPLVRKLEG